jgi:YidC/Oxa1 family membrane protein insertase
MSLAAIPVISPVFQGILDGIGWTLAGLYDLVGNYGVAIIVLTVLVRLVLLPLGIKQIQSMHNMQALQPKVKALQSKYKGNKQKQQEEIMKLYRESGVNPLSGCWPVLLQFPILIAMYAVLRPPVLSAVANQPDGTVTASDYANNHLPPESTLFANVTHETGTDFLTMNLQCSAIQAGSGQVTLRDAEGDPLVQGLRDAAGNPIPARLDCGEGFAVKVPYYLFLIGMVGSTFYQQRQMQRVSPPGSTNPQQQALFKILPIMFGIFGISFPVGLVVYWTTSNIWQIGQQHLMLRLGHIGPNAQSAPPRRRARTGWLGGLMARADDQRKRRETLRGGSDASGNAGSSDSRGRSASDEPSQPKQPGTRRPQGGSSPGTRRKPGSGGGSGSAGSRKKRPKR